VAPGLHRVVALIPFKQRWRPSFRTVKVRVLLDAATRLRGVDEVVRRTRTYVAFRELHDERSG